MTGTVPPMMVTVVVPVKNEEGAIGLVLEELKEEGFENVLVVDGHSTDRTVEIARQNGVKVVEQQGEGKTGAIRTALEQVSTPYLVVMDGDYTYPAEDIYWFLPYAEEYDQVLGRRTQGRKNISWTRRLGNWIINSAVHLLYDSSVNDVCTGMYLLNTEQAKKLELTTSGFSVEVEIAIQNIKQGSITEVPIGYRERIGEGKLSPWKHGIQILWTVLKTAF